MLIGGSLIKLHRYKRTFQVRKADSRDCSAILACLRAAFENYRTQYTLEGFADTVLDSETVQRRMREMCILVAVSEDETIGTIAFTKRGGEGPCGVWPYPLTGKERKQHQHCCVRPKVNF